MMPTIIKMIPIMPAGFIGLQSPPAADEVDDQNHDRDYEQNVNESAHRVRTDQTKQPEHQQNDKYCPKHNGFLGLSLPYFASEGRTALMEYGRFSKLLPGWLKYKILSPPKNTDSEATPPLVRLQTFLFLCLAPLLIACACQGTIVQKAGRSLPFAYSLGIDASFKF